MFGLILKHNAIHGLISLGDVRSPRFIRKEPSMWLGQDDEMKVAIPDASYKIVARKDGNSLKTLAFLVPNIVPKTMDSPSTFITSISRVEELTGLTFFTNYTGDKDFKNGKSSIIDW